MHKCIFMVQLDACSLLFENNNSQVNYLKRRFHLKRGSILAILALFSLFFPSSCCTSCLFSVFTWWMLLTTTPVATCFVWIFWVKSFTTGFFRFSFFSHTRSLAALSTALHVPFHYAEVYVSGRIHQKIESCKWDSTARRTKRGKNWDENSK